MWNTNSPIHTKEVSIYFAPKLKWYQKILQKLHIKNYYKKISGSVDISYWTHKRW